MIALSKNYRKQDLEKPFLGPEKLVCEKIEKKYNLTVKKLKMNYHVDFAAFDSTGTLRCFGEIKCRYFKSTKYDAPMVSAYKYLGIKEIHDTFNKPVFLYIQFIDSLYVWRYNDSDEIIIKWGGRTDRKRSNDIEPMAYIPLRYFERFDG